jgi:HEAT repeat protein
LRELLQDLARDVDLAIDRLGPGHADDVEEEDIAIYDGNRTGRGKEAFERIFGGEIRKSEALARETKDAFRSVLRRLEKKIAAEMAAWISQHLGQADHQEILRQGREQLVLKLRWERAGLERLLSTKLGEEAALEVWGQVQEKFLADQDSASPSACPPTLQEVLSAFVSGTAEDRSRATRAMVDSWASWSPYDLETLEKALPQLKGIVGRMAASALRQIRVRRELGEAILTRMPGIDRALVSGGEGLLKALVAAGDLREANRLTEEEIDRITSLAREIPWREGDAKRLCRRMEKKPIPVFAPLFADFLKHSHQSVRLDALDGLLSVHGVAFTGAIEACLADPDPAVRYNAIDTLSKLTASFSLKAIAPLLDDPEPMVQKGAIEAIQEFGSPEYGSQVARLLESPDETVRNSAILALGELGAVDTAERLLPFLSGTDDTRRSHASDALIKMAPLARTDALERLLADPRAEVRAQVSRILGETGAAGSLVKISALLNDPDANVRAQAVRAQRMGGRGRAPIVASRLADPSPNVREAALHTLNRLQDTAHVDQVARLLRDPDSWARQAAAAYLGRCPAREVLPCTLPLVGDATLPTHVRGEAMSVVGRVKDASAASVLRPFLQQRDLLLRLCAAGALHSIGDPAARAALLGMLESEDKETSRSACDFLKDADLSAEAPRLLKLLGHRLDHVRAQAKELVASLPPSEETRPRLGELFRDPDPNVRFDAADAASRFPVLNLAELLPNLFRDEDKRVRSRALETCRWLGLRELAGEVVKLLADPCTRRDAVQTLGVLAALEHSGVVAASLADADPEVRAEGAGALGFMAADEHMAALRERLRDGVSYVAAGACEALAQLGEADGQILRRFMNSGDFTLQEAALRAARLNRCGDLLEEVFLRVQAGELFVQSEAVKTLLALDPTEGGARLVRDLLSGLSSSTRALYLENLLVAHPDALESARNPQFETELARWTRSSNERLRTTAGLTLFALGKSTAQELGLTEPIEEPSNVRSWTAFRVLHPETYRALHTPWSTSATVDSIPLLEEEISRFGLELRPSWPGCFRGRIIRPERSSRRQVLNRLWDPGTFKSGVPWDVFIFEQGILRDATTDKAFKFWTEKLHHPVNDRL